MSSPNCCFLTCVQISQEAGEVAWCSRLCKSFPQCVMMHTVKGFSIVNEAEIDVFLEFPCFLYDPVNVGNLISGASAFSKSSVDICKFWVHILLKPSLKDFERNLASMWNECSGVIVWTFFVIAVLWDWNENCPFPAWPFFNLPWFRNLTVSYAILFSLQHQALLSPRLTVLSDTSTT